MNSRDIHIDYDVRKNSSNKSCNTPHEIDLSYSHPNYTNQQNHSYQLYHSPKTDKSDLKQVPEKVSDKLIDEF